MLYVLRRAGEKLPADVVRAHPISGWLYLGQDTRKLFPQEACRIFRDSKFEVDLHDPLVFPRVKFIKRGGMMISGQQEMRQSVWVPQAWWCVPGPMDDLTVPGAPISR